MKILVKFPSRERPHKFFLCIKKYIDLQSTKDVRYLITLDANDPLILAYKNHCEVLKSQGVKIDYMVGNSKGKIDAVNRDMDKSGKWDILVLASDDMECKTAGWDAILQNEMFDYYNDTDGVIWHNDGFTGQKLNTMCILGRKYFDRFGYIYHPKFVSLWCDNLFMEIANFLGKQTYFDQVLFKHEHPANMKINEDALGKHNESFYHKDKATYDELRKTEFKHLYYGDI